MIVTLKTEADPGVVTIDLEHSRVMVKTGNSVSEYAMDSPEAFSIVSKAWLRCGWDTKYVYSFTWMGRPIIQLPEDMVRIQEVIYKVRPDVVIETGVAHGGSLIFYASLFKAMGIDGSVMGIDIEIRPHNRRAIEAHELFSFITLLEGSSTAPDVVTRVRGLIRPSQKVMVILDSNHTRDHVLGELEAYAPLVTPGSYIVATDGIMQTLGGAPRSHPDWKWNNPQQAAVEFIRRHPEYVIEEPPFAFNEGVVNERVTYWPNAFIRRR